MIIISKGAWFRVKELEPLLKEDQESLVLTEEKKEEVQEESKIVNVDISALMPEEPKEIKIVEEKETKEKVDDIFLTDDKLKIVKIAFTTILAILTIYVTFQVAYNFYIGFKYKNVDSTTINE